MKKETNIFQSNDDKKIHYYKWSPEQPKAILQIVHGMGEHAGRYERQASDLVKHGFVCYASDHRGNGMTARSIEDIGYFEDGHFWKDTLADLAKMTEIAQSEHPTVPLFILGHSMGSFLVRDYITHVDAKPGGIMLSGTGGDPGILGKAGRIVAKFLASIYGRNSRSEFLRRISFGKFNKSFRPIRTPADWISRDERQVDKYLADPMCSKTFTTGFWIDMLEGVLKINKQSHYNKTPKDLPIYIFSGEQDPVGNFGKGVREVYGRYKKAGLGHVECHLYNKGRHEMLNEFNREEVINGMLDWMESRVASNNFRLH